MNRTYNMSHRLIACILLFGLFLQGCGGQNQLVSQEKKQQDRTLELSNNPLINADKEIVISGGYLASFYEEDGKLKADLRADAIQPQPNYKGIPTIIEPSTDLVKLTKLDPTTQQQHIQLSRKNGKIDQLVILNGGVAGGMNDEGTGQQSNQEKLGQTQQEENKEREKAKEPIEKEEEKEKEEGLTEEKKLDRLVDICNRINNNDEEAQKLIIDQCLKIFMSPLVRRLIQPFRWDNIEEKASKDEKYVFLLLMCINKENEEAKLLIRELVKSVEQHAQADILLAKTNLGLMYANGTGVDKDEKRTVELYQQAANQGYAAAQYNLGWMYANGRGVDKEEKKAVVLYQQAAGQGHTQAQYNLGVRYYNGKGVKKNYKQALIYYRQAAYQGHEEAKKDLSTLDLDSDSESDDEYSWTDDKGESNPPSEEIEEELEELNNKLRSGEQIDFSTYPKFVIPLYRGIHYLPICFKSKNDRKLFRQANQKSNPLYSSSAYEASDLNFLTPFSALKVKKKGKLQSNAQDIKNALDSLKGSCPASYHIFHEVYSNDHKKFHSMLDHALQKINDKDSEPVLQAFIKYINCLKRQVGNIPKFKFEEASLRNPHVSFSFKTRHPVKYAVGDKSFHDSKGNNTDSLRFSYDASGKPKHPYLGKVYVAFLTIKDFFELDPYVVIREHTLGKIKIINNDSNDILIEDEVTFAGYFPKNLVIHTVDIRCPRFDQGKYPNYYDRKHGITQETWKRRKSDVNKNELKSTNVYKSIVERQPYLLDNFTKQKAKDAGKTLIYPGFENDFILFPFSSTAAKYYAEILQGKDSIHVKDNPQRSPITPEEIIYIAKKLLDVNNEHVKKVKKFQTKICKIEDRKFIVFSDILRKNTYLTTLYLENGTFTKEGVSVLANALGGNTTLTYLGLYGSNAVGEAIEYIAEALKKNTALTKLDLASTNINGGEALQNIFKGVFENNTTLQQINLADNSGIDGDTKNYLEQNFKIIWNFESIQQTVSKWKKNKLN